MNFSTVFLLLIITHFSSSMKRVPRQQKMKRENSTKKSESETLVPLNLLKYPGAHEFLKLHSFGFRKSFIERIKVNASNIISSVRERRDGYGICKPVKSNPKLFTKESLRNCKEHCSRKNEEFVEALERSILQLINHLFYDTSLYDVLLTAINENIENCATFKNGNSKCVCTVKFKFTVSKELNNLLNFVLEPYDNLSVDSDYSLSEQQNYLIAAIISIGLQPRFATYFIPWLLRNLNTCTKLPKPVYLRKEHYQPSLRQPYRNQNSYITPYKSKISSNYMNLPHSQQISRLNYPPNYHSSHHVFDSSTSSSRDRRRTTYYTSSSYYYDENSDDAVNEENDDAGAGYVEDNGGVVGEINSLLDISLWDDLPDLCNCTSDNCNFTSNFDCFTGIDSSCFTNTDCSGLANINCSCLEDIDYSCFQDIFTDECIAEIVKQICGLMCNCIGFLLKSVFEALLELDL